MKKLKLIGKFSAFNSLIALKTDLRYFQFFYNVEFKSWKKVKEKELMRIITKEAIGMANTKGGIIFVVVEDDGEITGCENYDIQNILESIYNRTISKLFDDIDSIEVYKLKEKLKARDQESTLPNM